MKWLLFILGIVALMSAGSVLFFRSPAPTSTNHGDGTSGVHGVVLLGPTCPVERIPPDPNCAPKLYQTMVMVFRGTDLTQVYAIRKSDAAGAFSFALPPGEYTLGAGDSNLPRCDHPAISVSAGVYASTTIQCDTGIR